MSTELLPAWLPGWPPGSLAMSVPPSLPGSLPVSRGGDDGARIGDGPTARRVTPAPAIGRAFAAFADDLEIAQPVGTRYSAFRARLNDAQGPTKLRVDLTDSAPRLDAHGQPLRDLGWLSPDDARRALAWALHRAGVDTHAARECEVLWTPGSLCDASERCGDVAAWSHAFARLIDTYSGALAAAWPARVGAGSCDLAALVQLESTASTPSAQVWWVLPGGEGATPARAGRPADDLPADHDGDVSPTRPFALHIPTTDVIETHIAPRPGSGGGGARVGGDGLVAVLTATRACTLRLHAERGHNPPHGIDRAGPPLTTRAWITRAGDGASYPVALRSRCELGPGDALHVETCGGAGHGFPGWGVDWDPSDWFGDGTSSDRDPTA